MTQREFILNLIERALERAKEEVVGKEATQEKCSEDTWQLEYAPRQPYDISQRKPPRVPGRRIGYSGGLLTLLWKEGEIIEQQKNRSTDAEIEIAKETDLPDLPEPLGYQIRRVSHYHTTKEMDNLYIKNRRTQFRCSEGAGGGVVTLPWRLRDRNFPETTEYLLDYHDWTWDSPTPQKSVPSGGQDKQKNEPPPPFALLLPNTGQWRAFVYLQERDIAPQVIRGFVQTGLLHEGAEHHNCVFVGRNRSGVPVFANKHGIYNRSGPGFEDDVTGNDKNTVSHLPRRPRSNAVLIFETPVNLMGYCALYRQITSSAVALCGLHKGALDTYLRKNLQSRHIVLCLNASEPGQSAVGRLRTKYEATGYMMQSWAPPYDKDWNGYLQQRGPIREREDLRQTVTR